MASLIDKFIEAMIKADATQPNPQPQLNPQPQPQLNPQPQPQPNPQPQPQPNPQPQPQIDYKAEYERLLQENTTYKNQLAQAQKTNRDLLSSSTSNDARSFSDILRGVKFHPLYERRK